MLFSIITPVYNNTKYLRSAVNSVLNQSFSDFEYIIVDDGSTDGTAELADDIAKGDARVKVIHQENQWIYASNNNGIKAASGEYVFVLNSDDKMRENALSVVAGLIKDNNYPDVIWTLVLDHECDENQQITKYDVLGSQNKVKEDLIISDRESFTSSWVKIFESGLAENQANFYKRELALKHPFRTDIYTADKFFNIDLAEDINSCIICSSPVYDFFRYVGSGRNASVGKYYSYEHVSCNEFYEKSKELLIKWGRWNETERTALSRRRLVDYSRECRMLLLENCPMNVNEKLKHIFIDYLDDTVWECVECLGAFDEIDGRALSAVRGVLVKEDIDDEEEMFFAYSLLDSLLRYEKDEEDFVNIRIGVSNLNNPREIGKTFMRRLGVIQ